MRNLILILLLAGTLPLGAATWMVGPGHPYPSPNALYQANVIALGDTILIEAGTYSGNDALAVWHPDSLFIRGINGRPHLEAAGKYIWGKGIWVLAGDGITVENFEFSGARVPDHNGAGIRLDGTGMTVRHCYFHHNENGILTSNPYEGDILIEYCEFAHSGYGQGFSHNLYIGHVDKLTFRFNYSHHADVGHCLKSRARENHILYNRIMDEETGTSSRLIDLPNGGLAIITGNLLMQGPMAQNSNMLGYGPEGLSNEPPHDLYVVHNTFVNQRPNSGIFISIEPGTEYAYVANNILAGPGRAFSQMPDEKPGNLLGPELWPFRFADTTRYDYHLTEGSLAIDFGQAVDTSRDGLDLQPIFQYLHPTDKEPRITYGTAPDAGAYEFESPTATRRIRQPVILFWPNPVRDQLHLRGDLRRIQQIRVWSFQGRLMGTYPPAEMVDFSGLPPGSYLLETEQKNGRLKRSVFIKI